MRIKKSMVLFMAFMLLGVAAKVGAVERLSLATGGTAGTYYPIGSAIASIVMKHVPDLELTAESTGASVANIRMLQSKRVEFIMAASNTSWGAYQGHEPFKDAPVKNIRGMASLYPEVFQFIVLEDSGLKTMRDLKGKRVAVGAPGSGTERTANMVLEAHGITYDDIDEQFLNFGEAVTALKDGLIDCAIVGSGIPTSAVVDASASLHVQLLSVDRDVMEKFLVDIPYLAMIVIPGGIYRGVDEDVVTVASPAILSAEADVPDELVFNILKALFGNLDELSASHAQGKMIRLETALNAMSIPLHPGAQRFYRSVGMSK